LSRGDDGDAKNNDQDDLGSGEEEEEEEEAGGETVDDKRIYQICKYYHRRYVDSRVT